MVLMIGLVAPARAQEPIDPAQDLYAPGLVAPDLDFTLEAPLETLTAPSEIVPSLNPPPALPLGPLPPGPRYDLVLEARLVESGSPLQNGLLWRVFGTRPDAEGRLPLVQEVRGGTTTVSLPSGDYLVHAGFGRAGATKRVTIADDDQMESLVLDAGGLQLDSVVGEEAIAADKLHIEVMQEGDSGDLVTVVPNAAPGRVIRLSAGTYHVISRYGDVNAVVRADIDVEPGKLTEVIMRHIGAEVTLKLVSAAGGEALANTNWTVLTQDGNTVHESIGAFPSLVLAAGTYTAVASHQGEIYSRDFTVEPGVERDIEVRLSDIVQPESGPVPFGPPMQP
jgi:hypothetical protein